MMIQDEFQDSVSSSSRDADDELVIKPVQTSSEIDLGTEHRSKRRGKHSKEHKSSRRHHHHYHHHSHLKSSDSSRSQNRERKSHHYRYNRGKYQNRDSKVKFANEGSFLQRSKRLIKEVENNRERNVKHQEINDVRNVRLVGDIRESRKYSDKHQERSTHFLEEMKVKWKKKRIKWLQNQNKDEAWIKKEIDRQDKEYEKGINEQYQSKYTTYSGNQENLVECIQIDGAKNSSLNTLEIDHQDKKYVKEINEQYQSKYETYSGNQKNLIECIQIDGERNSSLISLVSSEEENMDSEEHEKNEVLIDEEKNPSSDHENTSVVLDINNGDDEAPSRSEESSRTESVSENEGVVSEKESLPVESPVKIETVATLREEVINTILSILENENYFKEKRNGIEENSNRNEDNQTHIEENRSHIEENRSHIEENRSHIEENKTHIEENKTHIEENKNNIDKNRYCIEEHRYIEEERNCIEENRYHIEEKRNFIEENKNHIEENRSCTEKNINSIKKTEISEITVEKCPFPKAIDLQIPKRPVYCPAIQGCRSIDKFHVLNRIEEGTYGVVYRARDKETKEIVALKRLKMEREKEGFPITSLREINTLLKAQHPNIVTVREIVVGSNMDRIYIVMDYVEHDLKSLMKTMPRPFLIGEVKTLLLQLLYAVAHLHDNWILHRDLKTSNLLLSHQGILKVGDFGLAREYGSPLKCYTPVVVTLWYRAPELLLGTKKYSTAIDMWSVGCIFGELLTKTALFPGKSESDQINRIFKELGTPSEKIWPGYSELPMVKSLTITHHPYNNLKSRFANTSFTDIGFDLLNRFLTYNPARRITAEKAKSHDFFNEKPKPVPPSMFPIWPAKSEQTHRAGKTSPKAPLAGIYFSRH